MPRLEVLVGPLASAKSTYASNRARQGAIIISRCRLVAMLHGDGSYDRGLRGCYRRMEDSIARTALVAGRDVVCDRSHLTIASRRRWIDFARDFDALMCFGGPTTPVIAVAFPIESPEVHAQRRWAADDRGRSLEDWLMVARHQFGLSRAEPLSEAEGFIEIIRIDVSCLTKVED